MSGEGIMKMFGTEDFGEGLTAFVEKRAPLEGPLALSAAALRRGVVAAA